MANKWTPFATVLLLLIPLTACELPRSKSDRLLLQLIEANGGEQPDPRIADVVEELHDTLPFEGYSLEAEMSVALKALEPEAEFGQEKRNDNGSPRIVFKLDSGVEATVLAERRGGNQTLSLRVDQGPETVLETTVGIEPDQTLVLGSVPQTDGTVLLMVVRMIKA